MKIIFMGTPEFAVPSLRALLSTHHQIIAVVTTPDLPRGRGQIISPTPVKEEALRTGIPILQPTSLKDTSFATAIANHKPDLIVVVAFRILPKEIFTVPIKGTMNVHASLLPKYRGAAPINWAIIDGENETGVTTFFIREKVDTGNIILTKKTEIFPDETAGDLHDRLSLLGAQALVETVDLIEHDRARPMQQDDSLASPAPKLFHDSCRIVWRRTAGEVHNFIRGLSPYPAAWTRYKNAEMKMYRSKIVVTDHTSEPGTILFCKRSLIIAAKQNAAEILELKPEGRKRMSADEFLRGYRMLEGEMMG